MSFPLRLPFAGVKYGGKVKLEFFFFLTVGVPFQSGISLACICVCVCVHCHIFSIVVVVVVSIISLWSRICHIRMIQIFLLSARVNQYTNTDTLFYNHLSIGGRYPPSQIVWHIRAHEKKPEIIISWKATQQKYKCGKSSLSSVRKYKSFFFYFFNDELRHTHNENWTFWAP